MLAYVQETQREAVPRLKLPRRYSPSGYVVLDGNTQRNLELVESMRDRSKRGTLLDVLDRTHTNMGARKLRDCGAAGCKKLAAAVGGGGGAAAKPAAKRPKKAA